MRKWVATGWLTIVVAFCVAAKAAPVLHFSASEKFHQTRGVSISPDSIRNNNQGDQQVSFQLNAHFVKVNTWRHSNLLLSSAAAAEITNSLLINELSLQNSATRYRYIQQILFPQHHFW